MDDEEPGDGPTRHAFTPLIGDLLLASAAVAAYAAWLGWHALETSVDGPPESVSPSYATHQVVGLAVTVLVLVVLAVVRTGRRPTHVVNVVAVALVGWFSFDRATGGRDPGQTHGRGLWGPGEYVRPTPEVRPGVDRHRGRGGTVAG